MRSAGRTLALAMALALTGAASAHAQGDPCFGETEADNVAQLPGPPLRFGITPGVQTGQLGSGPVPPRLPEDPAQQVAALHRLADLGERPFVLRLHRFFWSDGEPGVQRFLELADRYTREGFLVELQLRYHPSEQQEGDIDAWTAHVRDVVRRFGRNPRVVAIQVTNEVNLTFSPDSSDGSYERSRDALVQGVIAAKDEARKRGYDQLEIGFNWAYRSTPDADNAFWAHLRDHGGPEFVGSLDWLGLDAYPGTFFPPAEAPGEERDGMVNAMSSIRCYAARAGIPDTLPIHIEENGYPTGPAPDRSYERQVEVMRTLIGAVQDYRGTYNVSDYRWFNLRDGDSTTANFQTQYGLMRDDYTEKPAFGVYAQLVRDLSTREQPDTGDAAGSGPVLRVRCVRGRRNGWRASLSNVPGARRVDFLLDRRLVRRDRRAPFRASIPKRARGTHRITARSPGLAPLSRRVRPCRRTATSVTSKS
jgi:hypothetical protein